MLRVIAKHHDLCPGFQGKHTACRHLILSEGAFHTALVTECIAGQLIQIHLIDPLCRIVSWCQCNDLPPERQRSVPAVEAFHLLPLHVAGSDVVKHFNKSRIILSEDVCQFNKAEPALFIARCPEEKGSSIARQQEFRDLIFLHHRRQLIKVSEQDHLAAAKGVVLPPCKAHLKINHV